MTPQALQTQPPEASMPASTTAMCEPVAQPIVGALLRERFELSGDELEQHIDDLAWSWRIAYDRFERYGLPADRDDALMLLHLHNRAVIMRTPEAQAARWAEIKRRTDEGVGYFDAQGRKSWRCAQ